MVTNGYNIINDFIHISLHRRSPLHTLVDTTRTLIHSSMHCMWNSWKQVRILSFSLFTNLFIQMLHSFMASMTSTPLALLLSSSSTLTLPDGSSVLVVSGPVPLLKTLVGIRLIWSLVKPRLRPLTSSNCNNT